MVNTKKLRQAIKAGDIKQITEILREDPKGKLRLLGGFTPLHVAVKGGKKEVVEAILDAGGDINAKTEMHQTPLDLALRYGHTAVAELLRQRGGDPAAKLSLHSAVSAGDIKAVRKHFRAGVDLNEVANGELPLCLAFHCGHWDIANFLLNKGVSVTKAQKWGITPLHAAAASGAPEELLNKLLKLGAKVEEHDECQRTALCSAAEEGHDETVDWLLDHGADVTAGWQRGARPVDWALRKPHIELASHLIDRGAKCTLHQAIQCDHLARARQLLNSGADANEMNERPYGQTPLEIAVWLDSTDMVSLLIEFGADPNQQDRSFQGRDSMVGGNTSLHDAVNKGSAKMVKLLLANGADPDITNASGLTPIEQAERRDRTHLARLMEEHLDKKLSLNAAVTGIEQLYTIPKVAELLCVDDNFVLELIKARKISALHLDEKTTRISSGSVQRYLAKLKK